MGKRIGVHFSGASSPFRPFFRAAGRGALLVVAAVLLLSGCKTTGPIVQASTDFRLQNIEAALVKIQGEVKALEAKQAEGDQTWAEVRGKLEELTSLVRAKASGGVGAVEQTAPPPWAGTAQAGQAAPPKTAKESQPSARAGQTSADAKGTRFPPVEQGRPFPAAPPGQTAQAVQAASTAAPSPVATPPPAATAATSPAEPLTPTAELASATPSESAVRPSVNPPKTWEIPGPGEIPASGRPARSEPAEAKTSHSPYPAEVPAPQPSGATAAPAAAGPVATAVQAPQVQPAAGPTPRPFAAPESPVATASPPAGKASAAEEADYNKALKLALNGKPREAKAAFNEFLVRHPQSKLEPNVLYWIGESDLNLGEASQAARNFTEVSKRFPGHHKAADSLYKLGMTQEKLGDKAAAKAAYEALVKDYPSSELAGTARRKIENLSR